MSYFGKYYLSGADAQRAAEWIFTNNVRESDNRWNCDTGCPISWQSSVGSTLILVFHLPPCSAWADGKLAELLSSWTRRWNIPNQSQPNRGSPGEGSPCRVVFHQGQEKSFSISKDVHIKLDCDRVYSSTIWGFLSFVIFCEFSKCS